MAATRGGVAEFTRVGDTLKQAIGPHVFEVPPEQIQEVTLAVEQTIAALPKAIVDQGTCLRAKESLPVLKREEMRVIALWAKAKKLAHAAHAEICESENKQLQPIAKARTHLSRLIYEFEQEQQRLTREKERIAAQAAREQEQTVALEEAAAFEAAGEHEMAAQVVEQAIAAPAPVVVLPSPVVEVAGVSTRENWQFVYAGGSPGQKWKDLDDVTRKRVLQMMPREFLMPDEAAIGRVVKAMKSGTKIPGLQAYDAGTVVIRG